MNRARVLMTSALIGFWAIAGPWNAFAQSEKPTPPTVLTIHPAKEPDPALKYRLIPERRELIPGNAAIFYHRANLMVATGAKDPKSENKAIAWLAGPIKEIPRDEARSYVERFSRVLHEAELGAIRLDCDWEFDRREEGYDLLLPEVQEIRRVGRLVALKARVEIRDGHPGEAIHWIEVGFAMSRHLGETPFFIPGLVGVSIASQISQTLEELIQTPGSPNFYWALASRPRPLIEIRRGLEGERYLLERELPELRHADGPAWSTEKARNVGDEVFRKLKGLTGSMSMIAPVGAKAGGAGAPRLQDLPSRLALAAMVARVYPEAKRSLVAEGRNADDVEAMPTLQVVLIHTLREYSRFRDDVFKWTVFPFWQAGAHMDRVWKPHHTVATKLANPILTMFTDLMPATSSALLAGARIERLLDALQCVEAIRMYVADHDGKLPESLDAMTETPVPIDPINGKPFEYKKVDDATATLSASYPPRGPNIPQYTINYELKLAK